MHNAAQPFNSRHEPGVRSMRLVCAECLDPARAEDPRLMQGRHGMGRPRRNASYRGRRAPVAAQERGHTGRNGSLINGQSQGVSWMAISTPVCCTMRKPCARWRSPAMCLQALGMNMAQRARLRKWAKTHRVAASETHTVAASARETYPGFQASRHDSPGSITKCERALAVA